LIKLAGGLGYPRQSCFQAVFFCFCLEISFENQTFTFDLQSFPLLMKIREEAFQRYFYFIQERMNIFWKRYKGELPPYSEDPIFQQYKITNVYRVLDRVSQYLVKHVIYHPHMQTL